MWLVVHTTLLKKQIVLAKVRDFLSSSDGINADLTPYWSLMIHDWGSISHR